MPSDSINEGGRVVLRPGGVHEDADSAALPLNAYTQQSGFYQNGTIQRMPGKILDQELDGPILGIHGWGAAMILQVGDKLVFFPDACLAIAESEEGPVGNSVWMTSLPTNVQDFSFLSFRLVSPGNVLLHDFGPIGDLIGPIDFSLWITPGLDYFSFMAGPFLIPVVSVNTNPPGHATFASSYVTPDGVMVDGNVELGAIQVGG